VKVAIVRQRYNPYGGAERVVARVLPALERSGAEVTLISRGDQGWGARRVLRVDPFHLGNLWRDWSFARAARKAWRREGFDIVQSHERIPGCDVYRAGDGVHRRWLELRRASAGAVERLGIALNPYHAYVCGAEKEMFEHPRLRAVVCNSKMVREDIRRRFRIAPEKLHVIYNGVDVEQFHPRERERLREATRAHLGIGAHDMVFIYVGSGFARKGLGPAIDAVGRAANAKFRLLVAGRDRDHERFVRRAHAVGAAERVHFLGGREDMRPPYAAADCFVLPSLYDPFGAAVLEALAMGLPAIVSARCGAAELIEPGVNGWVCDPNDSAGIARLMRDAEAAIRRGDMNAAARATAERFSVDAMAAQLQRLYDTLATSAAA
jgi:UDP-glucose:(heptosyl)LPS alpha-1,3-glucosyltransferase